jgi:hypothetical protein
MNARREPQTPLDPPESWWGEDKPVMTDEALCEQVADTLVSYGADVEWFDKNAGEIRGWIVSAMSAYGRLVK